MTAHPIDTEALRGEIEAAVTDYQRVFPSPQKLSPNLALAVRALSALAATEHRATRAEAQSDIRGRAVVMYRDRARQAEARIKAVRDMHWADKALSGHVCAEDGHDWPCPTIRALDGEG